MPVTRRTAFVFCLIVLFGYEVYALFIRETGIAGHEPLVHERHLTREVNADTPLSITFRVHANGFSGVEIFARPSDQPPAGPMEVMISRETGETWTPVRRARLDVSRLDLNGSGSVMITTPHVDSSAGVFFRLDVAMPQAAPGQGLRFEAGGPTYIEGWMTIGGRAEWGDLKFRTMSERTTVFRNVRHLRHSWPPLLRNDAVLLLLLVIANWGLAMVIYYLAFAPEPPAAGAPGAPGTPAVAKGSALTTADQPRV
jgi:hypothetical protein